MFSPKSVLSLQLSYSLSSNFIFHSQSKHTSRIITPQFAQSNVLEFDRPGPKPGLPSFHLLCDSAKLFQLVLVSVAVAVSCLFSIYPPLVFRYKHVLIWCIGVTSSYWTFPGLALVIEKWEVTEWGFQETFPTGQLAFHFGPLFVTLPLCSLSGM